MAWKRTIGQSVGLFLVAADPADAVICCWLIADSQIDLALIKPCSLARFEELAASGQKPPCPVVILPQVPFDAAQLERLAGHGLCIVLLTPEGDAFDEGALRTAMASGAVLKLEYEPDSGKLSELLCRISAVDREVRGIPLTREEPAAGLLY